MVEIIKRGTKQRGICSACGCEFTFEKEDIKREDTDGYKGFRDYVQCPQCYEKVILQRTR